MGSHEHECMGYFIIISFFVNVKLGNTLYKKDFTNLTHTHTHMYWCVVSRSHAARERQLRVPAVWASRR